MKYVLATPLLLFIFTFTYCNKKEPVKISDSNKKEVKLSKFAKNYPDFDYLHFNETLQLKTVNDSILSPFYKENNYAPVWMHDTLDVDKINELVLLFNNSREHGLIPDLFFTSKIKTLTDSIDSGLFANNMTDLYEKIADLELTATKASMRYIEGMNYGFTNPKKLYKGDYDITTLSPDSLFYINLYKELKEDPIVCINNSHPSSDTYQKMQNEYRNLELKKDSALKKILSNTSYKVGDQNANIANIAHRLQLTEEYIPDALSGDTIEDMLTSNLMAAINKFRVKNSLPKEDVVSKSTLEMLDRPLQYYKDKLRVNMERYRWKRSKPKQEKHIEVNVASAMLTATHADSVPLKMRVCVGLITNKTPLLQSTISYLNLNPVWNVPTSIAQKEIAVIQKRDPSYISRHNMKLYRGGKEVDPSTINWKEVDPSRFSYTIRQSAGGGNALGLIKFMFNNSFSVYLHDTPSKAAFNRNNRAVSHGCVRVQKPFELAYFCLSPTSDIYKDQILYSVKKEPISDEGKKLLKAEKLQKVSDIINPKDKISLSIDYYTAYIFPLDEVIYYTEDVYKYDDILLNELIPSTKKKIATKETTPKKETM